MPDNRTLLEDSHKYHLGETARNLEPIIHRLVHFLITCKITSHMKSIPASSLFSYNLPYHTEGDKTENKEKERYTVKK